MDKYAIVEEYGRRIIEQVENSETKLAIFDGYGEDGKRKYRDAKLYDHFGKIGVIVFLGTEKECEENLIPQKVNKNVTRAK